MLDLEKYGVTMWEEEKILSFRQKLLAWYDENKRGLSQHYGIRDKEYCLILIQITSVIIVSNAQILFQNEHRPS